MDAGRLWLSDVLGIPLARLLHHLHLFILPHAISVWGLVFFWGEVGGGGKVPLKQITSYFHYSCLQLNLLAEIIRPRALLVDALTCLRVFPDAARFVCCDTFGSLIDGGIFGRARHPGSHLRGAPVTLVACLFLEGFKVADFPPIDNEWRSFGSGRADTELLSCSRLHTR